MTTSDLIRALRAEAESLKRGAQSLMQAADTIERKGIKESSREAELRLSCTMGCDLSHHRDCGWWKKAGYA